MTPEGKVRQHLRKQAKAIGWEHRKLKWIGRNGAPDEFIFHPDSPVPDCAYIEVKREGEEPEPHQWREINRLRKAGFTVFVVDRPLAVDLALSTLRKYP